MKKRLSEEVVKEQLESVLSNQAYHVLYSIGKYEFKRICWNVIDNKEEKEFMIECFKDTFNNLKKCDKYYTILHSIPNEWDKEIFAKYTINQL